METLDLRRKQEIEKRLIKSLHDELKKQFPDCSLNMEEDEKLSITIAKDDTTIYHVRMCESESPELGIERVVDEGLLDKQPQHMGVVDIADSISEKQIRKFLTELSAAERKLIGDSILKYVDAENGIRHELIDLKSGEYLHVKTYRSSGESVVSCISEWQAFNEYVKNAPDDMLSIPLLLERFSEKFVRFWEERSAEESSRVYHQGELAEFVNEASFITGNLSKDSDPLKSNHFEIWFHEQSAEFYMLEVKEGFKKQPYVITPENAFDHLAQGGQEDMVKTEEIMRAYFSKETVDKHIDFYYGAFEKPDNLLGAGHTPEAVNQVTKLAGEIMEKMKVLKSYEAFKSYAIELKKMAEENKIGLFKNITNLKMQIKDVLSKRGSSESGGTTEKQQPKLKV